jgi:hypothetical protein
MRWPGRTRNPSPLEQGLNSKCGGHSQSDRTPNARHVCRAFDGLALPRLTLLGDGAARGAYESVGKLSENAPLTV